MNREPIGLYIFRFIVGFGLFAFMIMLYWSSLLLENDVKTVQKQIEHLNEGIETIQSDMQKIRSELSQGIPRQVQSSSQTNTALSKLPNTNLSQIDPSFPNLLIEDPFYTTTLPKLLGENFKPQGTFHKAVLGKPDNLHPFTNWGFIMEWIGQCNVSVAQLAFGKYETFAPYMAIKVEERKNPKGQMEFWVHLRDGVFWQPLKSEWFPDGFKLAPEFTKKHQVTAQDFKFYWDALMNPSISETGAIALRTLFGDIEEIRVIDPLTFVVRWKGKEFKEANGEVVFKSKYIAKQLTGSLRPLASFVYQYYSDGKKIVENDEDPDTYRKNSVWAQQFSQHWAKNIIVSCGGWVFDGMTDRQINFRRNSDHFEPLAVLADKQEVQIRESLDVIWQNFKMNNLDTYNVRPDQIAESVRFLESPEYIKQKEKGFGIRRIDFVSRAYTYIGWNEARPFFSSKKVRQAMTMAIDRQRIIRQTINDMGIEINGTFYRYSPAYDASIEPWPYDPTRARRLLEEEGWYDSHGTGIIEKVIDGKRVPFKFSLTYYVKNPTSKAICEYIATALKEIGIDATLHGVDVADLSAVFEDKNFDALNLIWGLGTPPDDPRQLWHSSGAKEKGSSNAIGFANPEIDAIIDALDYESDPNKRTELYHKFDAIIHEEAPYTFLYTPKTAMLYRDYLQNVFIPAERQDLIPGANVAEPESSAFWIKL